MSENLVATARLLARAGAGKPRQSDLRRAVGTACYAVFHAVARDAADLLVGTGRASKRPEWSQVYRALDHGVAKAACTRIRDGGGPLAFVADAFVEPQLARRDADYDPAFRVGRSTAVFHCDQAAEALATLSCIPRPDRRAFAVALLFRNRR